VAKVDLPTQMEQHESSCGFHIRFDI